MNYNNTVKSTNISADVCLSLLFAQLTDNIHNDIISDSAFQLKTRRNNDEENSKKGNIADYGYCDLLNVFF